MTHHERLLDYLKQGHTISQMEAYDKFGMTSAQQRINELRRGDSTGMPPQPIKDRWETSASGARYKVYWLDIPPELPFTDRLSTNTRAQG